jgi:hypothetical protein
LAYILNACSWASGNPPNQSVSTEAPGPRWGLDLLKQSSQRPLLLLYGNDSDTTCNIYFTLLYVKDNLVRNRYRDQNNKYQDWWRIFPSREARNERCERNSRASLSRICPKNIRENSYGHAKFRIGVMLHNRYTKEDGFVTKVYRSAECGEIMCEMAGPILPGTWAGRHYVSDWVESVLELSDNAILKSDQSPLLPQ